MKVFGHFTHYVYCNAIYVQYLVIIKLFVSSFAYLDQKINKIEIKVVY